MERFKMSVRQICFIVIACFLPVKLIMMTAVTASAAGHTLWESAAMNFLMDTAFAAVFAIFIKRFKNQEYFSLLSKAYNAEFARVIYFLYGLFFMFKSAVPIIEQKTFIEITLYETTPNLLTFMPFYLFCGYFCYKGYKAVARCADITVWIAAAAIAGLIALTIPHTDFSELLPLFKGTPFSHTLKGSLSSGVWFFDSVYFVFFMGRFDEEKGQYRKIFTALLIQIAAVILYMTCIYAEFGSLTERQFFAPVKMGMFSVAFLNIGRIDYFASILLSVANVFAIALPLVVASQCFDKAFPLKKKYIVPVAVNVAMAALTLAASDKFNFVFRAIQSVSVYVFPVFCYLIPTVTMLFIKKGKVR